jgi:hypothetical protein
MRRTEKYNVAFVASHTCAFGKAIEHSANSRTLTAKSSIELLLHNCATQGTMNSIASDDQQKISL